MDTWIFDEVRLEGARVDGEEPYSAWRFGLCCFFGSIVAGELLYLLRNMSKHGREFAFFNFLIPVLGCLIVQFITLAGVMWLAYVPWREEYPSLVSFALGVGMFSSLWTPLAMAEVTSQIHFITETGTASHDAQGIKKRIDNVFIASCIVTNLVRNALWVARLEGAIGWDSVWAFQHFYFGVEGMTLLNIGWTAGLLNLTKPQNQEKVDRAIRLSLLPALVIRELFVYLHYNCFVLWSSSHHQSLYSVSWYGYRLGQAIFQGCLEVSIATALMHCATTIRQEALVHFD